MLSTKLRLFPDHRGGAASRPAVKREAEEGLEQKEMTVGSAYGANVDDPQELLNIARHHCQAIQTIIDQLTEIKSNTELRLLSQRLQRLAFHAAPRSRDGWGGEEP
jgi:hypothetical protein